MNKKIKTKKVNLGLVLLLSLTFSILLAVVSFKRLIIDKAPAQLGSTTSPTRIGTMTLLTSTPIYYHQVVEFYYVLPRKPQKANFIVVCNQGKWIFAAEGIPHPEITPRLLQGTISILMANESETLHLGGFNYTQPASCGAYLIDEGSPNGKPATVATNVAHFEILP